MKILRSKRKTIALIIESDASLTVRAPLHISQAEIDRVVRSKTAWIEAKQAEVRQKMGPPPFQPGGYAWHLGQRYPIEARSGASKAFDFKDGRFILSVAQVKHIEHVFSLFYQKEARAVIPPRAYDLAKRFGYTLDGVSITSARTRWGSCSTARRRLNFSWRLVQAPPEIIDGVILHELAHLKVRNHSPAFYAHLATLDPAWKVHRNWLKQHTPELLRI